MSSATTPSGDDLVERLTIAGANLECEATGAGGACFEAATRIQSLTAENEGLARERDEARHKLKRIPNGYVRNCYLDGAKIDEWVFFSEVIDNVEYVIARLDGFTIMPTIKAEAAQAEIATQVEQAFRDGLAYGSNVDGADPDLAWQQSRIRAALTPKPSEAT